MLLRKIFYLFAGSINKKLILSVTLYIILPVSLLYLYIFNYFEASLISKSTQSAFNNMSLIEGNLNKTMDSMMTTAKFISMDKNIINALAEKADEENISIKYFFDIEKLFSNIRVNYLNQYFHITIVPRNGDIISSWPRNYYDYSDFRKQKWYLDSLNLGGAFNWIAPQEQYIKNEETNEKFLISASTNILNDTFTQTLGTVLISINESELYKQLSPAYHYSTEGDIYLTDEKGIIISHRDKGLIGKSIYECGFAGSLFEADQGNSLYKLNGQQMLVNHLVLKKNRWKLIQVIPYNSVIAEPKQLMKQVLAASLILLIIVLIALMAFSSRITLPVRKLVRLMKKVEEGDMDVRLELKGIDEISILGQSFNNMMAKQKELITRISEEEKMLAEEQKKKDAIKLEMLMAQINPHFLFNTLNTIKWTAIMGATDTVAEMVSNLGILLERSINRGNDIISLKEELENVKSYIYIQRIRFNNRFTAEYDIPPELQNCMVPRFILQPIVENSIIHGLSKKEYGGVVGIRAVKNGDKLEVAVKDNGVGMEKHMAERLLKKTNTDADRLNGIGLANVEERIQLFYGSQYGLCINSALNLGTKVKMVLPYVLQEEKVAENGFGEG